MNDFELGVEVPSPEMLKLAQRIVDERKLRPLTEAEIIAGGVAFVMGPGGDEGTRACTCLTYPHTLGCGK